MKRSWTVGLLIALFISIFIYFSFDQITPGEIENAPDWVSLENAMESASVDDRLILIDIYEVGCRFCRQMDREVYPAESVRAMLDRSFHPVKINGRAETPLIYRGSEMPSSEFASMLGVSAYPFTVIMDSEGQVISQRRGFMGTSDLNRFMSDALSQN
ncbi:MAG: DUF255 domain-containing protein [Balneolaceae bacterium]